MDTRLKQLLEEGISTIDPTLADTKLGSRLARLYDEIELFNPKYALVNADGEQLVIRHLLDCLAPVRIFAGYGKGSTPTLRMADLGSGSGLPGLVLASVFDKWDISLVERMGRRAGFLRNTVAVMGLSSGVQVVQKDLSEVQDQYDIISFRAFRPFKDIVSDLDRILAPGGVILAYKSSEENIREEIQALEDYGCGAFEVRTEAYAVPMLDARRCLLIVSRK